MTVRSIHPDYILRTRSRFRAFSHSRPGVRSPHDSRAQKTGEPVSNGSTVSCGVAIAATDRYGSPASIRHCRSLHIWRSWMIRNLLGAVTLLLLTGAPALAQQTTGTITGRVVDQQGAAVPGATVTAKSSSTGFTRTEASDAEGVYRLSALPVGVYDVTAELPGFTTISKKAI